MSKYEQIIDLSNVTIEDCVVMYQCKNECAILSDGVLVDFTKEKEEVAI